MDFSDFYLFSDIDGTLGTVDRGIPERNTGAISRFVENGGHFALCTGRWAMDIKHFTKDVSVNGTCIINNGGAFYDYSTGKYFNVRTLPKQSLEYLRLLINEEDIFEVTAITQSGYFRIMNEESSWIPNDESLNCRIKKLEDVHSPQLRIVFSIRSSSAAEYLFYRWNYLDLPEVSFIRSSDTHIEMLPKGVNKGSALIELCREQGIPLNRTYFIGDNYNDREIFQVAGLSACVAETPVELQGLSNYVLGACMDGAIADFIQILHNISVISA